MDTRAFLEAVWPASGTYCLATPYTPPNAAPTYAHTIVHSIDEAVRAIELNRSKVNLFFCVHTLVADKVWNPNKKDKKTGALGAFEKRTHANMKEARCFFFDLDVGESTATCPKYTTRQEALDGLDQFLFRTRLPDPLVASSGGGYHVYWRLTEALGSLEWRGYATALHSVARREGLRADPARTSDQASVLRVVGTSNLKPGREPRPCVALQEGVETSTGSFLGQLRDLTGSDIRPAVAHQQQAQGNLQQGWDGPTATLEELKGVCEHVRDYSDRPVGERGEPILYHIGCGLIPLLEDGDDWFHELASRHPDFGDADKTATKLDQYVTQTGGIPPNCATLDAKCGGDACARCPNAKLGKNPLLIAAALRKKVALPPPTLSLALASVQPAAIVEPGFPYKRTKAGIVQTKTVKDKDGNESAEDITILPYDCFPFEDCRRTDLERAFTLWAFEVPHEGQVVVKITSAMMQDIRALHAQLLDYGIKVNRHEIERVSMFMSHYGRTLQEQLAASRQYDHLGWADAAHTEFILPNVLLKMDGTTQPCVMSAAVRDVARHIHTAGTLADQVDNLRFYADDKYLRHQFVVLCALAAPAFHATDFFGCVVNAAGESGGGKSSALFTGAGLWGNPKGYTANGTRTGSSLLGQQQKVFTLANLPYCIDEITNADDDKIRDFVLASSQAEEGDKLKNDGTPRPKRETFKSTIYLCSSNKSFHNLLGQGAEVSGAAAMRVFEMWFPEFLTGKPEAEAHMHKVLQCYGWIGPAALERYLKHRDYVDGCIRDVMAKIDRKLGLTGPERFWTAVIAVALVYGEFAASFGLVPFDLARLRDWLLNVQLPAMRGSVKESAAAQTADQLLGEFLNDNQAKTIQTNSDVVQHTQFSVTDPRGELVAEYDRATSVIYVRRDVFRRWLGDRKQNALQVISDLRATGAVAKLEVQRILGEGTLYARLRVGCLVVDMTKVSTQPHAISVAPTSNVIPLRKGVRA